MRTAASGFTLVELMIILAIAAVLATLAAPSFNQIIESERARGAATDIYIALSRARSEAIKRNTNVSLSPITAGNWAQGWQIPDPDSGDPIEKHAALSGNLSVVLSPTTMPSVVYRSSGRIQGGANASFSITGNFAPSARCVCLSLSGRPAIIPGACTSSSC